jgi:3-oxoacyl-[acyl-carrier protein] reductase
MKTVLITGASRGIGRATAIAFAKEGYNVVINYNLSEDKAKKLTNQLINEGLSAACKRADVSKYSDAENLINFTINRFGGIDVLVNNCGISKYGLITDLTRGEWDELFNVNVGSVYNCTKFALNNMIQNKSGSIVNVSSIWGITGASCEVAYSAAKAAIIGFTKALAKEVGPSGINVNCVAPGVINTDMIANLSAEDIKMIKEETPLGMIGEPCDIAKTILYLANDSSRFITGQVISPNGGIVI